jgi:hypothetical protein
MHRRIVPQLSSDSIEGIAQRDIHVRVFGMQSVRAVGVDRTAGNRNLDFHGKRTAFAAVPRWSLDDHPAIDDAIVKPSQAGGEFAHARLDRLGGSDVAEGETERRLHDSAAGSDEWLHCSRCPGQEHRGFRVPILGFSSQRSPSVMNIN